MKNNSNSFFKHVEIFMDHFELLPSSSRSVISVSGGVDSMVLLYLFIKLRQKGKIQTFEVLCFDHGLRLDSSSDARFVKEFCQQYAITCKVISFNLSTSSNIEHTARQRRQDVYREYQKRGRWIYQAHHIDDAFEWHLLQQLKSSTASLGIPLVRGKIIRPFLCVTKEMILNCASSLKLVFREDASNHDSRFERNYLRNEVIPIIKKRFPTYLKHFAFQMNREALYRRCYRLQKQGVAVKIEQHYLGQLRGVSIYFSNVEGGIDNFREFLFRAIHHISAKSRGSLSLEIDKLIVAFKKSRKGPMSFSGNVGCLLYGSALYFYPKNLEGSLKLSNEQPLLDIDQLWGHSYITISNRAVNKLLPVLKRYPDWLRPLCDKYHLISTAELYTQVYLTKRIKVAKLIDCKFRFVRLI